MKHSEILNMPAGIKLNQLIWWKVFDMTPAPENNDMTKLPDFGNDISQAMKVAEQVGDVIAEDKNRNINYLTLEHLGVFTKNKWAASFDSGLETEWYEDHNIGLYDYSVRADTAALAICRAALLVVMDWTY